MMNNAEHQYLEIMRDIMENGTEVPDRTGTGTKKVFGRSIRHNFSNGFPLLTTKKMHIKSIVGELLWFLRGTENAQFLIDNGITIWDEWMKDEMQSTWIEANYVLGYDRTKEYVKITEPTGRKILPHTYGVKWRNFDGVDQIANVIEGLKNNPFSRRHVVSAWDPRHIDDAALAWCHVLFQFNVREQLSDKPPYTDIIKHLDISVYQRSADWFLGVPYNIASYSFLLYMVAEEVGMKPGEMYYTFGDCHLYLNHLKQADEQLHRIPYNPPFFCLQNRYRCDGSRKSINEYKIEDFSISNYKHHPAIKAEVSV